MTPEVEARFKRIDEHLEQTARYLNSIDARLRGNRTQAKGGSVMTPEEVEKRFQRIERGLDFLVISQAQLTADVTRVNGDVAKLVDAVGSLVRLFERHISDGHGGKPKEEA